MKIIARISEVSESNFVQNTLTNTSAATPTLRPSSNNPKHAQIPFFCSPSHPAAKAAPQFFDLTDNQVVDRVLAGDDNAALYLLFGRYKRVVLDCSKYYSLDNNELVGILYDYFHTKDGLWWDPQRFLKDNFCAYYRSVVSGLARDLLHQNKGYHSLTRTTVEEVNGHTVTRKRKVWQQPETPFSSFYSSDPDDDAPQSYLESLAPAYDDQPALEARDTVSHYLSHLDETQRRTLLYRFGHGCSTKETIELLQADMQAGLIPTKFLTPASVDNAVSRLRRTLRQHHPSAVYHLSAVHQLLVA